MSQKLPFGDFKWVEENFNSAITWTLQKTKMKIVIQDIFLELMFNILKN